MRTYHRRIKLIQIPPHLYLASLPLIHLIHLSSLSLFDVTHNVYFPIRESALLPCFCEDELGVCAELAVGPREEGYAVGGGWCWAALGQLEEAGGDAHD